MASLEQGLITYLLTKSGVTDLVGTRVYPIRAPQSQTTYPLIVVTRVGSARVTDMGGEVGLAHARIQIDCWGKTQLSVINVEDAVRLVLSGYTGTAGTIAVRRAVYVGDNDAPVRPNDGSDVWVSRRSTDWDIWHTETAATP